ncbi:fatty acid hydroxylase [Xylophilus rhododendri]|uniref:Fatty acid hydroxylase n=1 Tax=Xylophilus rhododendri TaxID=2697032 RepID=A0A857J0J0_9BURK|nr:sterol desaturase family protein [Xylophilus rhododendri]QHI97107.1 fatty acid hydroxylase [Xylophilus rhododendri]
MNELLALGHAAVQWTSSHLIVPVLAQLPATLREAAGEPADIAEALLISLLQIGIIAFVMRPLESLAPAERWPHRKLAGLDRTYTLVMLLGLFPLFSFLVLTPMAHLLGASPAASGAQDEPTGLLAWVPWFGGHPWLLFALYYVVYDLTYYWMHRLQHELPWWWAMHSMHHSQRQMSCWANDRSHYLDGALQSIVLATVGLAMGVDTAQFALIVMISELVQSLSHANVRWGFGRIGGRLLVDPRFHRLHHMLRDPQRPQLHNCNFGQVLPWWDQLFGTALYGEPPRATGVSDPAVDADNGLGLVAQQWYTLRRFWAAVRCRDGWRLGEVSFDEKTLRPVRQDPGAGPH